MGYSARYHAVSLVAVFIALAIGILIGAEFGGETLSSTRKNLEHSLIGNLQDARARSDQLGGELGRSNEFAERVYPALVREQLNGRRIGLVAIGDLPGNVTDEVEEALGPTGARLVGVGVVREPVDIRGLAGDLSKTRFADIARNPETQSAFGVGIGRQIVRGGTLVEKVRGNLFSRASGNFGALDGVIVVRMRPEEMGPKRPRSPTSSNRPAERHRRNQDAGGRRRDQRRRASSISFFQGNNLSSVDDIDLTAGRLATVYALLGAEGSFGVKGSADRLLPDLIAPAGRQDDLDRLPGRDRGGAARRPRRRAGPARRRPGPRELPRRGRSPSRSARCWRRRRWSRWRRSPSSTTAATSNCSTPTCGAGCPTCSASSSSASSTTPSAGGSGRATPRGWRGHARALREGRLSTGAIKAVGALALAAYVVSGRGLESWRYLADVALLILATNCFNLLDLRPGRAEKGLALLGAGLCLGAWTLAPIELLGIFAGAVAVGAWFTLGERAMLGDTGSNLVGAIAGVWLLTSLDETGRLIALAAVVGLTIFGELRSISRTIESVPPLRWLDSLGRE